MPAPSSSSPLYFGQFWRQGPESNEDEVPFLIRKLWKSRTAPQAAAHAIQAFMEGVATNPSPPANAIQAFMEVILSTQIPKRRFEHSWGSVVARETEIVPFIPARRHVPTVPVVTRPFVQVFT